MSLSLNINHMQYSEASGSIVQDLVMNISKSEIVSILGPSGVGKTTLLRMIAGLEQNFEGVVKYDGIPIAQPKRRIQIMFQDNRLFPWLTVQQNIEFALSQTEWSKRKEKVEFLLSQVGLGHKKNSWPKELSGGEETRIALARALAGNPELLLLDEPFADLDVALKNTLQKQLTNSIKKIGATLIMVTHNVEDAVMMSDRVFIFNSSPMNKYTEISIDISQPRDKSNMIFQQKESEIINQLSLKNEF